MKFFKMNKGFEWCFFEKLQKTDLNGTFHTFFGVFSKLQKTDFVHRIHRVLVFWDGVLGVSLRFDGGTFFWEHQKKNPGNKVKK